MAMLIDCPSCERKLRVPDEFVGRNVRCPGCGETFPAPAPAAAPAAPSSPAETTPAPEPAPPLNVALKLELDDGPPAPRPATAAAPQETPRRAEEKPPRQRRKPEPEDEGWDDRPRSRRRDFEPCPRCGDDISRGAVVCPYCGLDLEEQGDGYTRRPRVRHDAEPHRGGTVLGLGVASLVLGMIYFFALIALPLGIAAWVMGRHDLRKMEEGVMDPNGRKKTKDGWLCGLIGTFVSLFYALISLGFIVLFVVAESQPAAPAPPPVGGKQQWRPQPQPQPRPQFDNFTLRGLAPISLRPGETKTVTVTVDRALTFRGNVVVKVVDSANLEVTPHEVDLPGGQQQATFRIKAKEDAVPGEKGEKIVQLSASSLADERVLLDIRVKVVAGP